MHEMVPLLTLDEALALARIVPLPVMAPISVVERSPAVFERLGLESRVDVDLPSTVDVTGVIGLRAQSCGADAFWAETTAPRLPMLIEAVVQGPLRDRVQALYAEFESMSVGEPIGVSVFATLDETRDLAEQRRDTLAVAMCLFGEDGWERSVRPVERCIAALGEHCRAYHIGWMLGRASLEARICALGEPRALARWTKRLGWAGDERRLLERIDALRGDDCTVAVQSSAGDEPPRELGIELAPRFDFFGGRELEAWAALGERLIRLGFARASHVEALLQWQGAHRVRARHDGPIFRTERTLSHVKVVVDDQGATRCKIYGSVVSTVEGRTGSIASSQTEMKSIP